MINIQITDPYLESAEVPVLGRPASQEQEKKRFFSKQPPTKIYNLIS